MVGVKEGGMNRFKRKQCPKCGKFLPMGTLINKLARKEDGSPIYIKLYGEACAVCDYRHLEDYYKHIAQAGLRPY